MIALFIVLSVSLAHGRLYIVTMQTGGDFEVTTGQIYVTLKGEAESHTIPILNETTSILKNTRYQKNDYKTPFTVLEGFNATLMHNAPVPISVSKIVVFPWYLVRPGDLLSEHLAISMRKTFCTNMNVIASHVQVPLVATQSDYC